MKITEIDIVYGGGMKLGQISRDNESKEGSILNYDFYNNSTVEGDVYYVVDGNSIIAGCVGNNIHINGTTYFQIKGVMVDNAYRGQHIGSDMYNMIMHIRHQNLMSDLEQTTDGMKLWQTIEKTHPVSVLDLETGGIVSDDSADAYPYNANKRVLITTARITESIIIPNYTKRK